METGDNIKINCPESALLDNAVMKIGDNTSVNAAKAIVIHQKGSVNIGNDCHYNFYWLLVCGNAILNIGSCGTGADNIHINIPPGTEIHIGRDCMFAHNISLLSNDGHAVFDVKTKKNISSAEEISKRRKIIIGDHVWIGMNTSILYDTEIGAGSIIGAGSLVKGVIPNNCIAAGDPARVIRKDIAWSRKYRSDDISDCGEEYIGLTRD
ncbi:MAG: hypothetical protein J1F64_11415 [Oscillospiraceae bacterium]|nr:hypothetical protein [Oscillospiraceae bacterium]